MCDNAVIMKPIRGRSGVKQEIEFSIQRSRQSPQIQRLKAVWPEVWKLMRPRRGLLALGFVLMVVNKVAGFVLPYSSKFLIDNVVARHQTGLLRPLVFVGIARDCNSGHDFLFADTAALKGRAEADCGTARASAGAHLAPARHFL